jgi:hypothetical protein
MVTFLMALNGASWSHDPTSHSAKCYLALFGYVIDERSELKSFRVSKVIDARTIDPRTGSAPAVDVNVPEDYIAAARANFMAQNQAQKPTIDKDGQLKEMFTAFVFDPLRPNWASYKPDSKCQSRM